MEDNSDLTLSEEIEDSMEGKFLIFRIGDEEFGIAIRSVIEIIGIQSITVLAGTPAYVKGVINLRGKAVPVIDARLRFGLQEIEYDDHTCIIVVNIFETSVGLIVDSVSEIKDINIDNIKELPKEDKHEGNQFIQGLGKVGGAVKTLLNIERLLLEDDLQLLSEIT